jgi:RecA/RadA recombinase
MFGGDSGTGKTFLCLNIVREAQKNGVYTIWVDTEHTNTTFWYTLINTTKNLSIK